MSQESTHTSLWDLVQETRFCMLSHRHEDGTLHAQPLTTQNKDLLDGCLYFFVGRHSGLGERLRRDDQVNLSYANVKKDSWLSITGTARVLEDPQKKKELFGQMDKAWFQGPDDPELELVQVRIDEAEYWNVTESKIAQVFKMAKASVTGQRPQLGEHRELRFHH